MSSTAPGQRSVTKFHPPSRIPTYNAAASCAVATIVPLTSCEQTHPTSAQKTARSAVLVHSPSLPSYSPASTLNLNATAPRLQTKTLPKSESSRASYNITVSSKTPERSRSKLPNGTVASWEELEASLAGISEKLKPLLALAAQQSLPAGAFPSPQLTHASSNSTTAFQPSATHKSLAGTPQAAVPIAPSAGALTRDSPLPQPSNTEATATQTLAPQTPAPAQWHDESQNLLLVPQYHFGRTSRPQELPEHPGSNSSDGSSCLVHNQLFEAAARAGAPDHLHRDLTNPADQNKTAPSSEPPTAVHMRYHPLSVAKPTSGKPPAPKVRPASPLNLQIPATSVGGYLWEGSSGCLTPTKSALASSTSRLSHSGSTRTVRWADLEDSALEAPRLDDAELRAARAAIQAQLSPVTSRTASMLGPAQRQHSVDSAALQAARLQIQAHLSGSVTQQDSGGAALSTMSLITRRLHSTHSTRGAGAADWLTSDEVCDWLMAGLTSDEDRMLASNSGYTVRNNLQHSTAHSAAHGAAQGTAQSWAEQAGAMQTATAHSTAPAAAGGENSRVSPPAHSAGGNWANASVRSTAYSTAQLQARPSGQAHSTPQQTQPSGMSRVDALHVMAQLRADEELSLDCSAAADAFMQLQPPATNLAPATAPSGNSTAAGGKSPPGEAGADPSADRALVPWGVVGMRPMVPAQHGAARSTHSRRPVWPWACCSTAMVHS